MSLKTLFVVSMLAVSVCGCSSLSEVSAKQIAPAYDVKLTGEVVATGNPGEKVPDEVCVKIATEKLPGMNVTDCKSLSALTQDIHRLTRLFGQRVIDSDDFVAKRDFATAINDILPALWWINQSYYKQMTPEEFKVALMRFVDKLDSHSQFYDMKQMVEYKESEKGGFPSGVGLQMGPLQGNFVSVIPIEDSAAARAGLKSGDRIIKVDDTLIVSMESIDAVQKMIRGEKPGTTVVLTVLRKGVEKPLVFPVVRTAVQTVFIKGSVVPGEGAKKYGVLRISQFKGKTVKELDDRIKGALETIFTEAGGRIDGLTVDLRDDPGGFLHSAIFVSSLLHGKAGDVVVQIRDRKGVHPYSGVDEDKKPVDGKSTSGDPRLANVPKLVLVNKGSASASEIVAGNAKCYGDAVIAGSDATTFGKGSVQVVVPLGANDGIDKTGVRLTQHEYLVCGKVAIQGVGVRPDILLASEGDDDGIPYVREADLRGSIKGSNTTGDTLSGKSIKETDPVQYQAALDMLLALKLSIKAK